MAQATVVTAFYLLEKSKHPLSNYRKWITSFLSSVDAPIIIFCEKEMEPLIREARGDKKLTIVILPFKNLPFQDESWMGFWEKTMEEQDDFRDLHSPQQFIIWNSKTLLVEEAIDMNPYKTDKFVWCDAGCWRNDALARAVGGTWPSAEKIPDEGMLFLDVEDISWQREKVRNGTPWYEINTRNARSACIGGTIFAGSVAAWKEWSKAYYTMLNTYKDHNWFAGDDQSVMMSTDLYLLDKATHLQAPQTDGYFNGMGDKWFALQVFLQ